MRNLPMQLKNIGLFLMLVTSMACTHSIHQVYLSSQDKIPATIKTEWLEVEKSDFVVLGFTTNTSYVESAYEALEQKCPGRISQISTEHLTSYYFLSYKQRIRLKGLCSSAS
jgi:hypothetical protein